MTPGFASLKQLVLSLLRNVSCSSSGVAFIQLCSLFATLTLFQASYRRSISWWFVARQFFSIRRSSCIWPEWCLFWSKWDRFQSVSHSTTCNWQRSGCHCASQCFCCQAWFWCISNRQWILPWTGCCCACYVTCSTMYLWTCNVTCREHELKHAIQHVLIIIKNWNKIKNNKSNWNVRIETCNSTCVYYYIYNKCIK